MSVGAALNGRNGRQLRALALLERQRRAVGEEIARRGDRPALDFLTWTMVRRRVLAPGKDFDLVQHPFLAELYRERSREMVVMKAGQVGASELLISWVLWSADERQATGLYVFPTDAHVSDFSAARVGPAIEASEYLAEIVVQGNTGRGEADGLRKRGADRVMLKRVRDRFVYFRGAKVDGRGNAPQLKSVDADVLVLDELDEMDPRAPEIALKRLGHSRLAEVRWVSTPTYVGIGIHGKWKESDQREWHVRCEGCGERQPLSIGQVVVEWDELGRPRRWHGQEQGTAWVACRRCGERVDRLGAGEWVATHPERDVAGYHLTKLFSPLASLSEMVETLITTDETARKECFNQDLGEPYVPRGGQLTDDVLDSCRREYGHGPVPGERTSMGVDVGKVLYCVIRGPANAETGERPQRWAGEVESFEGIGVLMRRFNVGTLVIDALPETRKARELQESFPPGRVWLAYYVGQRVGSKRAEAAQWDEGEWVVNLDRTRTLDETLSRFYEGKNTLPADARRVRDFYDHLKAQVRVIEEGPGGQRVARYVESGPDHLGHAENYCAVADSRPWRSLAVVFS